MTDAPKHSVSVAGVVVDDAGQVFVVERRDKGYWEPPGDVLEPDETPEDGAREIFGETGLDVEVERLAEVYKNMPRRTIALVHRCHYASGEASASIESQQVAWRMPEQVGRDMGPTYAVLASDVLSGSARVTEAHDGKKNLRERRIAAVASTSGTRS